MKTCPIPTARSAFSLCVRRRPRRQASNGKRVMNDFVLSSPQEFRRLPGLFRRWELAQVLEAGEDYHIEDAGTTSDGTMVFAIYRRVPALWECKSLNDKSWKDTVKRGVVISKPIYAAQIATYQAYMEASVPGISQSPALFTAINKDTAELHHELVPFNGGLAQMASDKAVRSIRAIEAGELLPRIAQSADFHECRFCSWSDRCWRIGDGR